MADNRIPEKYLPMPMCIADANGKVKMICDAEHEIFDEDAKKGGELYALADVRRTDCEAVLAGEKTVTVSRNDRVYKISVVRGEDDEMYIYFIDISTQERLKKIYNEERACLAIVQIDNYEELKQSKDEEGRLALITTIDKMIRQWAARLNASITRYTSDKYFLVMETQAADKLAEGKFSILDDMREIETEGDFPVTLSIGIGISGKTFAQTDKYAEEALDLALGRGGDQAVIKNISNIQFYGGKTQAVEKSNKGKSRIVAHALKMLVDQADNVIIMGHRDPDMDAFGAALGITRMIKSAGKDAYIVVNNVTESLAEMYKHAVEAEIYNLIDSEKAISLVNENTLVILLDTHRPSLADCPEVLSKTKNIAIIDHHRKSGETVENPTLSYMEAYASSTSELVTEMIQYSEDKKSITRFEAEALLAGIMVDTNSFSVKAGVRTFEAASWLRRAGADTTAVKRFFQEDSASLVMKANALSEARFTEDGKVAFSLLRGNSTEAQILCAQTADRLLAIKGVQASFVAGKNNSGRTVVSARSLGTINVQTIMEKFNGGGHLTTAGAQVSEPPEEILATIETYIKEITKED